MRRKPMKSDHSNVLGFLTLAAGGDVELDALTLVQRLVATSLDVGEVNEDIVFALSRDKAEALFVVEELHGTGSQCTLSSVMSRSAAGSAEQCKTPEPSRGRRDREPSG